MNVLVCDICEYIMFDENMKHNALGKIAQYQFTMRSFTKRFIQD